MQLSDDQVVRLLISRYKQAGIDLAYVVNDPVFNDLPLASKVDALKQYAGEMAEGTRSGFNKSDLKQVAIGAGFGAVSGGLSVPLMLSRYLGPASKSLAGNLAHSRAVNGAIAAGVLGGAAVGALTGFFDNESKRRARAAAKQSLETVARNPTDPHAIYGLSSMRSNTGSGFLNRLSGLVNERFKDNNTNHITSLYDENFKRQTSFINSQNLNSN